VDSGCVKWLLLSFQTDKFPGCDSDRMFGPSQPGRVAMGGGRRWITGFKFVLNGGGLKLAQWAETKRAIWTRCSRRGSLYGLNQPGHDKALTQALNKSLNMIKLKS
jgi:hypothetical protein